MIWCVLIRQWNRYSPVEKDSIFSMMSFASTNWKATLFFNQKSLFLWTCPTEAGRLFEMFIRTIWFSTEYSLVFFPRDIFARCATINLCKLGMTKKNESGIFVCCVNGISGGCWGWMQAQKQISFFADPKNLLSCMRPSFRNQTRTLKRSVLARHVSKRNTNGKTTTRQHDN